MTLILSSPFSSPLGKICVSDFELCWVTNCGPNVDNISLILLWTEEIGGHFEKFTKY